MYVFGIWLQALGGAQLPKTSPANLSAAMARDTYRHGASATRPATDRVPFSHCLFIPHAAAKTNPPWSGAIAMDASTSAAFAATYTASSHTTLHGHSVATATCMPKMALHRFAMVKPMDATHSAYSPACHVFAGNQVPNAITMRCFIFFVGVCVKFFL
jgi:hypothetical protein